MEESNCSQHTKQTNNNNDDDDDNNNNNNNNNIMTFFCLQYKFVRKDRSNNNKCQLASSGPF